MRRRIDYRAGDLFRAAAARMSVLKASSSISSPSWKSIARLALPSRLALNSPEGSLSEAPLAKVSFTTLLYVSPVQISPSWDQTGTPLHFHSSTTSGSACLMRARTWESVLPLQSSSSLILASISREGDSAWAVALFFILFVAPSAVFYVPAVGLLRRSPCRLYWSCGCSGLCNDSN